MYSRHIVRADLSADCPIKDFVRDSRGGSIKRKHFGWVSPASLKNDQAPNLPGRGRKSLAPAGIPAGGVHTSRAAFSPWTTKDIREVIMRQHIDPGMARYLDNNAEDS